MPSEYYIGLHCFWGDDDDNDNGHCTIFLIFEILRGNMRCWIRVGYYLDNNQGKRMEEEIRPNQSIHKE